MAALFCGRVFSNQPPRATGLVALSTEPVCCRSRVSVVRRGFHWQLGYLAAADGKWTDVVRLATGGFSPLRYLLGTDLVAQPRRVLRHALDVPQTLASGGSEGVGSDGNCGCNEIRPRSIYLRSAGFSGPLSFTGLGGSSAKSGVDGRGAKTCSWLKGTVWTGSDAA